MFDCACGQPQSYDKTSLPLFAKPQNPLIACCLPNLGDRGTSEFGYSFFTLLIIEALARNLIV